MAYCSRKKNKKKDFSVDARGSYQPRGGGLLNPTPVCVPMVRRQGPPRVARHIFSTRISGMMGFTMKVPIPAALQRSS